MLFEKVKEQTYNYYNSDTYVRITLFGHFLFVKMAVSTAISRNRNTI